MSSSKNTNSNQPVVPGAREALTSREAGSVGGQMVKKMIQAYENGMQ